MSRCILKRMGHVAYITRVTRHKTRHSLHVTSHTSHVTRQKKRHEHTHTLPVNPGPRGHKRENARHDVHQRVGGVVHKGT